MKIDGIKKMTPLFLVLIIIEFTDLIFAVDSIPAIFSVTKDPYIVFFSNIFAIIGLLFYVLFIGRYYRQIQILKVGLAALLTFIGLKDVIAYYLDDLGFTNHPFINCNCEYFRIEHFLRLCFSQKIRKKRNIKLKLMKIDRINTKLLKI